AYRRAARLQQKTRKKAERENYERILKILSEARRTQTAGELEKARDLVSVLLAEHSKNTAGTQLELASTQARELVKNIEITILERKEQERIERKSRELLAQGQQLASTKNYAAAISCLQTAEPAVTGVDSVKRKLAEYRRLAQTQAEAAERAQQAQQHMDLA